MSQHAHTHRPAAPKGEVDIDSGGTHHEHHMGVKEYLWVFGGLMLLLFLTLQVATWELGPFNILVAMAVAIAKTALVMMFFMHLKFSSKLITLFAVAAFFWLSIMFILTMGDYYSRSWMAMPRM